MPCGDLFERRLEPEIGCNPARHDQHTLRDRAEAFRIDLDGPLGAIADNVGNRLLEARGKIGDVLIAERRAGLRLVAERGLEAGEREMRLGAPEHRPRQRNGRAPTRSMALDLGAAGIGKAEQLGRLVEGFAQRIVERRAEPLIGTDILDDDGLGMAAGDQQQKKLKIAE